MSIQQEKFTEIANAIRAKTGSTDLIKPSEFASKVDEVYESGKQAELDSLSELNTSLEEALYSTSEGGTSYYDRFWDIFQNYGNKTNYGSAFGGFTKALFKPKYDMKVKNAMNMFHRAFIDDKGVGENVDLVELLNELGITLDFSECTEFSNWLLWGAITRVGVIDCKSLKSQLRFYYAHVLKTIDKLILYEGNGTSFMWQGTTKLENITIEGTIEKDFDIRYTTVLTHDSLMSIINALKDLSGSGTSLTLTIGSTNISKLTIEEQNIVEQKGWVLA